MNGSSREPELGKLSCPAGRGASEADGSAPRRGRLSTLADLRNYIFGSSAAIITDVSLIVGLGSARAGKGPILAGLLTIAVADNISDSLGIHMYKECEGLGQRFSLLSTILNFFSRLFISLTFIAIVIFLPMADALYVGLIWGLLLIGFISYLISRSNHENPVREIAIHILTAVVVIALSRFLGHETAVFFAK